MKFLKPEADIKKLITSLINNFNEKIKNKDIHSQVIDPFSAIIEASLNQLNYENWIKSETARQRQKSLQNSIGELHQKLLGCIKGVTDLSVGGVIDIVCDDKKIIAEIKTKHNTVKKTDLSSVYVELENALQKNEFKDYTAYYVEIIPAKPVKYNISFNPIDNNTKKQKTLREDIRRIDGKSFYELLTNDPQALQKINDKIKTILNKEFNLQNSDLFNNLFLRAYDNIFFLKEKSVDINILEKDIGICLIEQKETSISKKLTWKHGNCEFNATIKNLKKESFKCPNCKTKLKGK
ncbi:Eco47II family restriction endonuclease [Aliarcobacter butzleri]|uniref:Eco47II family restriction endonuclease n=1 Tax=Aliarcobacter butzleri TaxID=28197 RepID=UPI003AFAD95B